jgi:hypothetical protein
VTVSTRLAIRVVSRLAVVEVVTERIRFTISFEEPDERDLDRRREPVGSGMPRSVQILLVSR